MKLKFFQGKIDDEFENKVDDWLSKNTNIEIFDTIVRNDEVGGMLITTVVFFYDFYEYNVDYDCCQNKKYTIN